MSWGGSENETFWSVRSDLEILEIRNSWLVLNSCETFAVKNKAMT